MKPTLSLAFRATTPLRLHPTLRLVPPQLFRTPPLRDPFEPSDKPEWQIREEKIEMWRRGEWTDELSTPPGLNLSMPYKEALRLGKVRPSSFIVNKNDADDQMGWVEQGRHIDELSEDVTSQTSAQGDDGNGHGKKDGDDTIQSLPVKKKVPAANVFWTDNLRML